MWRSIATLGLALMLPAIRAYAQCPNGTPPPCTAPRRPQAPKPLTGVASIRVLSSTPLAGTTLKWQELEKGVPLHVVVEHAVQQVPPGLAPVFVAFVNLTPEKTNRGYQRVLETRSIQKRPTQQGFDWLLKTEYVRQKRITIAIHVGFSPASDTSLNSPRGVRLSYEWAASMTLVFPVSDSASSVPR